MKRLFNKKQHSPSRGQSTTPDQSQSQTPPLASSSPPPPIPSAQQQLPPPPRVENVGNAIGWSVAMPTFDFPYLLALCDYLSSSSQASKDAAKALRTEFKHGTPVAQERAVRLTGILMRNTDHRFREQVAAKKFLSDLTDLVSSKKTGPTVKEMVFKVLSPLAYDYQHDRDLSAITVAYNKLVTTPSTSIDSFPNQLDANLYKRNGSPLDPEDPLFTPTGLLPSSSTRSGRPHRSNRRGGGGDREAVPKELEKVQMRELGERADKARGLARLLNEAVVFNGKDDDASSLETNEMIQEFQTQCLEEQSILGENMVWATVQAEKSREQADAAQPSTNREHEGPAVVEEDEEEENSTESPEEREMRRSRLSSNNPFASQAVVNNSPSGRRGVSKTEEETILEKILIAHSEIQDALSLLSSRTNQARQERQHAEDLATATNLSKTYVRGGDDISAGREGNYGEGGSKQRWESVEDRERAEHEAMLREQEELDRYEKEKQSTTPQGGGGGYAHNDSIYSNPTSPFNDFASAPQHETRDMGDASPYDGLGALESLKGLDFSTPSPAPAQAPPPPLPSHQAGPRSSFPSSNPYSNLSLSTSIENETSSSSRDPFTESPVSSSFLPPQPSEKALGKLRRISTTGKSEDDGAERQRVLEEQLRDKYRRNLEERESGQEDGGIREV